MSDPRHVARGRAASVATEDCALVSGGGGPWVAETAERVAAERGRRLAVGIFSYGLPVVGKKRGGVDRVAHDLAQGLAERGHRVTVLSYDEAPTDAAYRVRQLPWGRFARTWLGQRLTLGYFGNVLAAVANWGDAEVVIAVGDSLLLPLRGRPVVRIIQGSALGEAIAATSFLRRFAQIGVYAQELLTGVVQKGCVGGSENVRRFNPFVRRVIPNGVDLSLFRPDPEVRSEEPTILFVGTLDGRKRGQLLLDWFRTEIRPDHPAARLMMVSPPGPAVDGVTYHVGLSGNELAELYRRAWVYASPSSYEGFGLPYVEAMASGTPVVASPNPGSREVLGDGRYGRLASDSDFAAAIAELLSDVEARERWTQLGLERAKQYDVSRMIDTYEELLWEMVGAAPEGLDK